MTATRNADNQGSGSTQQRTQGSTWLEDLRSHRRTFRESRLQWTGEHAIDIVTRHTGGQIEFTTVAHLRRLQREHNEITEYLTQCRMAMGEPLRAAAAGVAGGWNAVAEAVGLTPGNARATAERALHVPREHWTNPDVRRVLRHIPLSNPVVEVWELKQLVALFEAAHDLVEDTLCDLVVELLGNHPVSVLQEAIGTRYLERRVHRARSLRGGPGDARRIPRQQF